MAQAFLLYRQLDLKQESITEGSKEGGRCEEESNRGRERKNTERERAREKEGDNER